MQSKEAKVVLLGDSGVGKTSLVYRFVMDNFDPNLDPTIGAAFMARNMILDGINYKFQIWDTAGQEKYHSLAPLYYRDAQAAIIVFDLTQKDSYKIMKKWVNELLQHADKNISTFLKKVIAIAGNKCDLRDQIQVQIEELQKYANVIQLSSGPESNILNNKCKIKHGNRSTFVKIKEIFKSIAQQVNIDNEDDFYKDNNQSIIYPPKKNNNCQC